MATFDSRGIMKYIDKDNNMYIVYPVTKAEDVEGLNEVLIPLEENFNAMSTEFNTLKNNVLYIDSFDAETFTLNTVSADYTKE